MKRVRYIAILGNASFILWILYNGVDEGFHDIATVQGIVPLVLVILLIVNLMLLWKSSPPDPS